MPNGQRRIRPWRATGLYRGRATGTTPAPTPQQRQSVADLRDRLVADHLQNDPTAGQQVILDLLTFAKIRHADAMNYLSTMPRPWIDRRAHRAWRIVGDLARMERHIAKLVTALVDPALERRLSPPEDLAAYIARKDAEAANGGSPPAPEDPAPVSPPAASDSSNWKGAGAESAESAQRGSPPLGDSDSREQGASVESVGSVGGVAVPAEAPAPDPGTTQESRAQSAQSSLCEPHSRVSP
jgi:hypothetical protein